MLKRATKMKHNTYYTLLDSLYYNSLLSSRLLKIDTNDNLQIVELSPLKNRNEVIPLDLIDAKPRITNKPDSQLMLFGIVSALASALFFISSIYANQPWSMAFAALFLLSSIGAIFTAFKKFTTVYIYQFANTNTPLFTLRESFSENEQIKTFTDTLNERITNLSEESIEESTDNNSNKSTDKNDDKHSQYANHLDFLYNHGVINDVLYKRINRKINEKIFGIDDLEPLGNIIHFPVKI